MKKIRKSNKGFTLVELIIVIAIIAILSAVAAPQYIKWVDKSRWSQDQNNAQILLTAVQTAVADPDFDIENSTAAVTFDANGVTVDSNGELGDYFDEIGVDTDIEVTNTGKAAGTDPHTTFTVVVNDNEVTGSWS